MRGGFEQYFVFITLVSKDKYTQRVRFRQQSKKWDYTAWLTQCEAVCYTICKYAWRHKWQLQSYKWKEDKCDGFIALLLCERVSESIYRKLIFFFIFTFIELVNFKQNPINFRTQTKTLVICPQTSYIFIFEQYLLKIMMLTFIEMNMVYVISPTSSDMGYVLGIPVTTTSN